MFLYAHCVVFTCSRLVFVTSTNTPDVSNILAVGTTSHTPAPVSNLCAERMEVKINEPGPPPPVGKLKLNMALLQRKLQEAKANNQNMVQAGNILQKGAPTIANSVANGAKATEDTKNETVHKSTVGTPPKV